MINQKNTTRPLLAFISAVTLLTLTASPLYAQDKVAKLIDDARCYACHQQSEPSLGPPWQAIAARHSVRKDLMTDVLARKIVNGGGGNWGLVPMVPNQWVSIDEARTMARWILEQNK